MPSETIPPLCPINALPQTALGLADQKILIIVTAVNSFTQRTLAYLEYLNFKHVSVQLATSDEEMFGACNTWNPDLVICPFMTRRIPVSIFSKWITLVVHPGPPGDAGPSSLDWALLGDDGTIVDPIEALDHVLKTSHEGWSNRQRSHWGTIVFQANEHLDGGAIWAWEQYELPPIGTITKAGLYQTHHSVAAIYALITAMVRVYETTTGLKPSERMSVKPKDEWQSNSLTHDSPFLGGLTHERPLISSKARKPDWAIHTADDVARIVFASDSQPGAQLVPLTQNSQTSLFAYGAHAHQSASSVPRTLYTALGYAAWEDIPNGTPLATRNGAVFFKTLPSHTGGPVGVWLTHGRIPKKAGSPLEPKIPMADAVRTSGHGAVLEGVQEWGQTDFEKAEGVWQEVWVQTEVVQGKLAQCVYWDFYNGAFSTGQCQTLLRACQWATAPERGNVKGGSYFSNGIALNTIEAASNPGQETWANINAIDDIVEYIISDTHAERSAFMSSAPLVERGIVTIACLRGNAAAGGVAMAAACDIVMASRGIVLNPAYRAMGLHGSEFHSFSYLARCGPKIAGNMLREMLPQSSAQSRSTGLVDIEIGTAVTSRKEIEMECIATIRTLLTSTTALPMACAPWARPLAAAPCPTCACTSNSSADLIGAMCQAKTKAFAARGTPLVHYRTEELSQMLLDSFHPVRSKRYHDRRYKFIRKVKAAGTPARYAKHLGGSVVDEEDLETFDAAPRWVRGEEWGWVDQPTPISMASSEWTRIKLYETAVPAVREPVSAAAASEAPEVMGAAQMPENPRKVSVASQLSASTSATSEGDDAGLPLTPPVHSEATLSRASLFRRKAADESPSRSATLKWKTLGRKAILAFKPDSDDKDREEKKTVRGVIPSFSRGRPSTSAGTRTEEEELQIKLDKKKKRLSGISMVYQRPQVEGADRVEFPCLYEPEGETARAR